MDNNEQQQENEFPMSRNNEFWLKLTDEEVWLRAYLVGFQCDEIKSTEQCEGFANDTLTRFKKRFPNERT